jgi:hypothetical protein
MFVFVFGRAVISSQPATTKTQKGRELTHIVRDYFSKTSAQLVSVPRDIFKAKRKGEREKERESCHRRQSTRWPPEFLSFPIRFFVVV